MPPKLFLIPNYVMKHNVIVFMTSLSAVYFVSSQWAVSIQYMFISEASGGYMKLQ